MNEFGRGHPDLSLPKKPVQGVQTRLAGALQQRVFGRDSAPAGAMPQTMQQLGGGQMPTATITNEPVPFAVPMGGMSADTPVQVDPFRAQMAPAGEFLPDDMAGAVQGEEALAPTRPDVLPGVGGVEPGRPAWGAPAPADDYYSMTLPDVVIEGTPEDPVPETGLAYAMRQLLSRFRSLSPGPGPNETDVSAAVQRYLNRPGRM